MWRPLLLLFEMRVVGVKAHILAKTACFFAAFGFSCIRVCKQTSGCLACDNSRPSRRFLLNCAASGCATDSLCFPSLHVGSETPAEILPAGITEDKLKQALGVEEECLMCLCCVAGAQRV